MSGEELRINGTTDAVKQNRNIDPEAAKKAAKEKAALELINNIAGQKGYKESMSTDDLQKELEKDLKALHSKRTRDDKKRGVTGFAPINDETYKTAMDVLEKQMNYRAEAHEAFAQQKVKEIAGLTRHLVGENTGIDVTNDKDVRAFVREGLKAEYEAGNLTKEQYDAARKYGETKKGTHFFKSIWRGITGGQKESSVVYQSVGQNNNVAQVRNNEKGPQYDEKLQKKLDAAGITDELIYQIGDNLVGAEAVVSYSNKKIQAGEAEFIADELDKYARRNGSTERFTAKEAREIMKGAGYGIEKKVDAKKVVRDMVIPTSLGAAAGVPMAQIDVLQDQNVNINYGDFGASDKIEQSQALKAVPWAPVVTAAVAAGLSALNSVKEQLTRVEDKAIPVQIDSDIKTIGDYVEFVKDSKTFPTKQAKAMAMKIAAYYTTDDGTLLKDQLLDAYRHAGGSAGDGDNNRDASVLNHREAIALLTKLESGEIKVKKPEPVDTPTSTVAPKENHYVNLQTEIEETTEPTDCYKVKSGDDWATVIRNVYNVSDWNDINYLVRQVKDKYFEENKEELTKKGITSSTGAFFPKVGADLCLPCTIKGKDQEYKLNTKVDFKRNKPSEEYKGVTFTAASNPFQTTKRSEFYVVNSHDDEKLNRETYAGSDRNKAESVVKSYEDQYKIKRTESEYVNGTRTK